MRNFIAFVNALLIVSSILSYVCCLPTQQPETVDEDSSASEEYSTCFAIPEDISDDDLASKNLFAADSEGKLCFVRFNPRRYPLLENEDEIDARFANVTGEFCPLWPESKKCLLDHLNSDRCNSEDRKEVERMKTLNEEIVFSELLCNPQRNINFLNLVKSMRKENLWDCMELESVKDALDNCMTKRLEETENISTFQDYFHVFGCVEPGLRVCANGDPVREAKLVQLWGEFGRTFLETYTAFWK